LSYSADKKGTIQYSQPGLSEDLGTSLAIFEEIFTDDVTFQLREFSCRSDNRVRCATLYLDGMISSRIINEDIIQPITLAHLENTPGLFQTILTSVIVGGEITQESDMDSIIKALLYGDTILLVHGFAQAIVVGSKGFTVRSISEPDDEKSLRGPREGFTESVMMNASMVRRKLQTSDLKFKSRTFGTRSNTRAFICYLDSLVDKGILAELEARLDRICIDGALDINYIQEHIKDSPRSIFKTCGNTEKPDVVAAKLLEGRVAIILDGTPIVLTVPYLFIENLQVTDDYYTNFYYGNIGRILRILGFFITISAPAVYVSLVSFHPEMIPTGLMLSIAAANSKVPFPTVVECMGMLAVFEILRETGIRTPNKIGSALSIVGALIVGQAAVEARIVSAPVVIIISLTGITGLMVPRMSGAVIFLRFALIAAAACLGFYGYFLALITLFFYITGLDSFGVDYSSQLFSYNPAHLKDIYLRPSMSRMNTRPLTFNNDVER